MFITTFAGYADLLAHHALAGGESAGNHLLLDLVGVLDGDVGVALAQGRNGFALDEGFRAHRRVG
jgi:hypothetical protein